ncbi:MAG TPA: carboxypeptidase-like regulatory domain-containing protein [Terriglobales bacterium]|nr:carboxypeptidase-like regulatory domain-containing protein [Terriglobales bacterium]
MLRLSSAATVLLACAVVLSSAAHAQSTFGSILGVVKDPSGLVIPAAKITLLSLEEQSTHDTASEMDGSFQFMNVKPGRYEITANAQGFNQFKLESVQLEARQTLRVDLSMKVHSGSEIVDVGSTAPMINTESATLAESKDFIQISQLPVNYRGATTSSLAMLATVPGTQQDGNGNVTIGGGLPSQVQYSVDGASTVNIRQNGALANMNPSSELISEFKVSQFNNNAEFAQLGDVTIATKSGGDHFHGSAFEYLQNSALDATTYGFPSKPHKAFNTFGGSLGGPLRIPHLTGKTPHTFFFVAYEGNRRRTVTPLFLNVPSLDMRAGNLNELTGSYGRVVDPLTGQPFANNTIPANRISATSASLLQNYLTQLPNATAAGANYLQQTATPSNTDGYDIRVDHTLTNKQSLYVRWSAKNISTTIANPLLPSDQDSETDRNLIFSHNYAITNTLVNEARFGLSMFRMSVQFPIQGATAVQDLGLLGLDLSDHPDASAFPTFNFNDGTGLTPIGRDKAGVTKSQTIQFTDNLSWARGKHSLKFGADIRRVAYADIESFGGSDDFGAFTFTSGALTGNKACGDPTATAPYLCESAFADFLLGLPAKTYVAQSGPDVLAHTWQTGLYAQDEWRIHPRLTLSFGLRWQALPPFVSPLNNLTAFDKRNGGVIVPDHNVPVQGFLESINACAGAYNPYGISNPALPCGPVESASSQGLGSGVREFYKKNFQPRIGFAYRPFGNEKTVIRGGFGIFTMTNLGQLSFNTTNISVGVVRTTANGVVSGLPAYQFPNVRTPDNPLTIAGTGDFYQNTPINYRDPQSAQWNLTVERELIRDTTLRVSYVGTNSYRMSQTVDLNQVPPSAVSPNPNLRPYLNWGRILSSENQGSVNYEALQSEINHRSRGGLTLQASHVWAKSLGNVGGDAPTAFSPEVIYGTPVANRFDLAANRGDVAAVRRNRVLVSAIYELPVGNGRHFLNHMSSVPQAIFGGWSISTVSMWQTGPFLTPVTSPNYDPGNLNLVYRGALQRPDCVANGNLSQPTVNEYFNINAFNPVPAGATGNCRVGSLVGAGTVAIAGGLSKTFAIGEKARIKFESTFTNLPNHLNYAAPSTDVSSPATFGKITSVQTAENAGNRTGQLALRVEF